MAINDQRPSRDDMHCITSDARRTVCMSVDSELQTSTKTSASRQNRSIHESRSGETSIPGLQYNSETTENSRLGCGLHLHSVG